MIRGLTLVEVIWPNDALGTQIVAPVDGSCATEPAFKFGFANWGVLKALKNSVRKSSVNFSFHHGRGVRLRIARSRLFCAGPRTAPTGKFPKPVPPSTVITGGAVRQLG